MHAQKALDSAALGFEVWKNTSLSERKKFLENYLKKLEEQKEDLAQTLTLENGQPLNLNRNEIEIVLKQGPSLLHLLETELNETAHSLSIPRGPAVSIGSFCRPIFFTQRLVTPGRVIVVKPKLTADVNVLPPLS